MNEDHAWDRMTDAIDAKFGLASHGRETRPVADAHELNEQVTWVTFERGGQTLKLERVTGPAIIDRKTVGARRAGSDVHFENVYDPHETARRTNLYRQDGDDWQALDMDNLSL
jgi:hypothetical protein